MSNIYTKNAIVNPMKLCFDGKNNLLDFVNK